MDQYESIILEQFKGLVIFFNIHLMEWLLQINHMISLMKMKDNSTCIISKHMFYANPIVNDYSNEKTFMSYDVAPNKSVRNYYWVT
jgi:hypothetical protein